MAHLKGYDGSMKVGGTAMPCTAWTYTGTIGQAENTVIGSTDKSFTSTTREGSGSLTVNFDPSNAQQIAICNNLLSSATVTAVWLQLWYNSTGTQQLSFSAVINSIDMPVSANDADVATINFTKTGNLFSVPTTAS
jgi:hypothetical protein